MTASGPRSRSWTSPATSSAWTARPTAKVSCRGSPNGSVAPWAATATTDRSNTVGSHQARTTGRNIAPDTPTGAFAIEISSPAANPASTHPTTAPTNAARMTTRLSRRVTPQLAVLGESAPQAGRFGRYQSVVHTKMPKIPHWYLGVLATRPDHWGRRLGRTSNDGDS